VNETGTDAETHEKALTTPVRGLRTTRRASVGNPTSESCEVLTHHEPIGASVDLTNTTSALYETDSEESGEEFRTTRRHLPATRQQTDRRHHTVESDGRAPEGLGGKGSASLGDYLAAIGKVSRLTRVDEVALARSIQAGLAADVPYVPLWQTNQQVVFKPTVSGIVLDPVQFFRYFTISVS